MRSISDMISKIVTIPEKFSMTQKIYNTANALGLIGAIFAISHMVDMSKEMTGK